MQGLRGFAQIIKAMYTEGLSALQSRRWGMARSLNVALACVAMLAAALLGYVMTPHQLMARTHDVFDIDAHIPHAFGQWAALPGLQAVKPPPDGLEAEIYNQEVSRAYVDKEGHAVMLMIAYGESQSDRLQLHHPEVCYTAQGFRVTKPYTTQFAYSPDAKPLPITHMTATREGRTEPIDYWMRIGYDVTNSNWARNALKLKYGLRGWIPDGALFRVSTIDLPADKSQEVLDTFIRDLLANLPPETRSFMVGDPSKALL
jgi:EpsI family protein